MILTIRSVSGLATIQDLGWASQRAIGLPPSGAVDRAALCIANALVGNPVTTAGIELTLGPIEIETSHSVLVAATGSVGEWRSGDQILSPATTVALPAGSRFRLGPGPQTRFGYLAISGGMAVPEQLGSRATYLPTGLGGWHGRGLRPGDVLPVGEPSPAPPAGTAADSIAAPTETPIRITGAGHDHLFDERAVAALVSAPYRILPQSDRMGSRLAGPTIHPRTRATLPSEGTCLGAIQVPDDGNPIVILHDGPTVGGYPKVAAVIGADLGRFAQVPLGGQVQFAWTSRAAAERAARQAHAALGRLVAAIGPRDSTAR